MTLSFSRVRAFHEWKVKQLAFREVARIENMRRHNRQRGFIINPYAYGSATDPYFANVVSLAHFNDSPDSFTGPFVDQIAARSPGWTRNSIGAQTSGVTVKYGPRSMNCGSVGAYNADHADWDFGSGDFTLEGWVNLAATLNGLGNSQVLTSKRAGAGFAPFIVLATATTTYPQLYCSTSGSAWDGSVAQTSVSISINTWYHVAACRSGTSLYLFVDGTQAGSTGSLTGSLMSISDGVGVGGEYLNTLFGMNGFVDDFRATKGVARYTANFTPPAAQFPDS
jgi:hypothetical protein